MDFTPGDKLSSGFRAGATAASCLDLNRDTLPGVAPSGMSRLILLPGHHSTGWQRAAQRKERGSEDKGEEAEGREGGRDVGGGEGGLTGRCVSPTRRSSDNDYGGTTGAPVHMRRLKSGGGETRRCRGGQGCEGGVQGGGQGCEGGGGVHGGAGGCRYALVVDDRGKIEVLGGTQHTANGPHQTGQHSLHAKGVTHNLARQGSGVNGARAKGRWGGGQGRG
jgi:hypothetical protein